MQYQIIAEAEENPQGDSFFIAMHLFVCAEPIRRIQHPLFLLRLVRKRKPRQRRAYFRARRLKINARRRNRADEAFVDGA